MSASTREIARARRLYVLLAGAAVALAAISLWLAAASAEAGSIRSLVQFGIVVAAIGAAAATWAAAVRIAVVYHVNWPLVVATITLVVGLVAALARG